MTKKQTSQEVSAKAGAILSMSIDDFGKLVTMGYRAYGAPADALRVDPELAPQKEEFERLFADIKSVCASAISQDETSD